MNQGKIKTLTEKGFGFITVEGQRKDLFFHGSELKNARFDELRVGDLLEFETSQGPKGSFATNISLVTN